MQVSTARKNLTSKIESYQLANKVGPNTIARAARISKRTMGRVLHDRNYNPTLATLVRLSNAMGKNLSSLIGQ